MTDATEQSKIMEAAHEAAAIARGEMPAGRWTIKGHAYVPAAEADGLRKQNQELQNALSCMTASRDRWRAEAKGKITDEWRRRVAAGEEGEV